MGSRTRATRSHNLPRDSCAPRHVRHRVTKNPNTFSESTESTTRVAHVDFSMLSPSDVMSCALQSTIHNVHWHWWVKMTLCTCRLPVNMKHIINEQWVLTHAECIAPRTPFAPLVYLSRTSPQVLHQISLVTYTHNCCHVSAETYDHCGFCMLVLM